MTETAQGKMAVRYVGVIDTSLLLPGPVFDRFTPPDTNDRGMKPCSIVSALALDVQRNTPQSMELRL